MADQRNSDGRSGGGGGLEIDLETFGRRLQLFYTSWRDNFEELWGSANSIAIVAPPPSEDLRYLKSSALHTWLLSYEFPDTIMVFTRGSEGGKYCHVLCSVKKASHLEEVRKACKGLSGVEMVLHPKEKKEDGSVQIGKLLEAGRKAGGSSAKIGLLTKEPTEGPMMEKWEELLGSSELERVDVANGFSDLFAIKDDSEITNIKKAAFLSASVLKNFVVPKLETVIDEEQQMTHADLMESTEEVISEPTKAKVKLKSENCDICYPPVFQSGGTFDLKANAQSNDEPLYYNQMGVIICALGARYSSYCSNVARTYLIDACPEQEKAYKVLLKAHDAAIAALRPGNPLSTVYKAAVAVVEREGPEFVGNITKNAGTGIGIEFREGGLPLNSKSELRVKPGMVFNVVLGLQGLTNSEAKDPRAQTYAVLLADTVIVKPDKPEVVTGSASKAYTEVGYSFQDGESEKSEEKKPNIRKEELNIPDEIRKAKLRSETQEATKEEIRKKHQAELAERKLEETARRLQDGGLGQDAGDGPKKSTGDLVAYRNVDDIPTFRELMIQVDQKNEAVLLPIYGLMVPFHISTIKNASSQQDGGHSFIRVIFNVPGGGYGASDLAVLKFPDSIYLKEVSFRSSDVRHSNQVVQLIKTMARQVKQRESERAERATLVTQERLVLAKGRPFRLSDLWIRPSFGGRGRKLTGTLEAHFNGFRYQTAKSDERVDVMYRNIKHAFFQPAENEMITLLHLHLHNPIMVGTKKTKDVQFYAEVVEANQAVGGARRSGYDPDEIEEEQRERARRNKINSDFQVFAKRVQEQWEKDIKDLDLEFDVPFRDLGFHGVPHKSSAFIVPTVNCLVELIEQPFVVITLSDVEIVSLERIGLGQKTFDMRIVFKDFKRDVLSIDAIPSSSLDSIKEWLNSMNIKYYESRLNLQWKPILNNIMKDPQSFLETGGWEFLNLEGSDSEEDGSQDSEPYEPSDVEEASESDDDSEDDESVVDSEEDEDEDEDAEEEEEEEGLTWEELEEKAKKEDRELGGESDSGDERRRRKGKGPGSGPQRRPMPPSGRGPPPGRSAPPPGRNGPSPSSRNGSSPFSRNGPSPSSRNGPSPSSRNGPSPSSRNGPPGRGPPPPQRRGPPPPQAKRQRL